MKAPLSIFVALCFIGATYMTCFFVALCRRAAQVSKTVVEGFNSETWELPESESLHATAGRQISG